MAGHGIRPAPPGQFPPGIGYNVTAPHTRPVSTEQQQTITRDSVPVRSGLEVERFEMKDVKLPEAIRETRARIIKADAELEASEKLAAASQQMAANPSDFITLSKSLTQYVKEHAAPAPPSQNQ